MMTIRQIAERLGLVVNYTYALTLKRDFPPPAKIVGQQKFWDEDDIEFFKALRLDWRTKDGRAAKRRKRPSAL
jgi:predicted DNA-binding transcriptional regulator AlpA